MLPPAAHRSRGAIGFTLSQARREDGAVMPRVLIPLPDREFDPTEVAVPYRVMKASGIDVVFATPVGRKTSLPYAALEAGGFDALLLADGYRARGMRAFLESPLLQGLVADFFDSGQPVAAICHGVVLAARIGQIFRKSPCTPCLPSNISLFAVQQI